MASVTRRTGGTRSRREEVEARVFQTVERLLAAGESYTTLGVQRICAEAGVARSSFYSLFADKTDLLLRLAASATEDIFAASERLFTAAPEVGFAGLRDTQANSIRIFREHAPLITAVAETAAYDELVAGYWRSRMERTVAATAERITRERAAGRIRPEVHPERAARFIVAGAERSMLHQAVHEPPETDAEAAGQLTEMVLTLLYGSAR